MRALRAPAIWSLGLAAWAWVAHVFAPWRDRELVAAWAVGVMLMLVLAIKGPGLIRRALGLLPAFGFAAMGLLAGPLAMEAVSRAEHLPAASPGGSAFEAGSAAADIRAVPVPELWFPGSLPDDEDSFAESFLAGELRLLDRPGFRFGEVIDWKADPFLDRTWQLLLHSLVHTRPLTRRYRETGDVAALQLAGRVIQQWIERNSAWHLAPPSEFSWNDHAIAFRSLAILDYSLAAADRASAQEMALLLRSLKGHARALASPLHYSPRHNHGLDQDVALLSLAVFLHPWPEARQWRALAVSRLQAQLSETISSQGVHLEHSPGYHFSTLIHLVELYRIARRFGIEEFTEPTFVALLHRMAEFGRWTVQPDDRLVAFGDSFRWQNATVFAGRLQQLVRAEPGLSGLSIDPDGPPRSAGLKAYPQEGYAFYSTRDSGGARIHHVALTAAHHAGLAHKHADDLAVVISACGASLLVDHGGYGYNYDRWRSYFLSRPAHNTLSLSEVGRDGLQVRDDGRPRITAALDCPDVALVQAETQLSADVRHRRTLLIRNGRHLLIHDRLIRSSRSIARSLGTVAFLHWHLAPDLDVRADETGGVFLVGSASARAALAVSSLGHARIDVISGRDEPALGWASIERNAVIKAQTLQSRLDGAEEVVTAISLPRDCGAASTPAMPAVSMGRTVQGTAVAWTTDDGVWNLSFGRHASLPAVAHRRVAQGATGRQSNRRAGRPLPSRVAPSGRQCAAIHRSSPGTSVRPAESGARARGSTMASTSGRVRAKSA